MRLAGAVRHLGLVGCVFACALVQAPPVFALDPDKRLSQYLHRSWQTQDGSAPATMFSISQTADGFLWFSAHPHGIYRFDGVRFLPWHLPSTEDSALLDLVGDRRGGMWVTNDIGIAHVDARGAVDARFELKGVLPRAGTSVDPDGSLWIVRGRNAVADAPLCHVTTRAVTCFGKADGIPISPADVLLPDGSGGFWIGGQTALVRWRPGVSQLYPIDRLKTNAGNNGIEGLARGPDGTLWIGILAAGPGLGLGQLRNGAFATFSTDAFDGSQAPVYTTIVDRDGNLWAGTNGKGIYRIRGNVVDHYGRADGLSSDSVISLFEDASGIVWAATTKGIDSFRDPSVATFSASQGLGNDAATGVLASRDGSIWVANAGSLDRIVNGTVRSIRRADGLPGDQVTSWLEDRAGNLWVGVDDHLYLFTEGRFRRLPEPDQRPLGLVVGLAEDIEGNIWAACGGNPRKLVRIRDFQVLDTFLKDRVPPGHTLAADPNGGIWIGTLTGDLVLFRGGAVKPFALASKGNHVSHQIVARPDGSVLAATDDGLVGLRQGRLQRMTTDNGLPCNSMISFIQDRAQRWWIHTNCGIVEVADADVQRWWGDPKTIVRTKVYGTLDGAQPEMPSFNSAASSADGRVWFATGVVVQMLDPSRLPTAAPAAPPHIESLIVDRRKFSPTDNLRLSAHPRDLQIDYTSPTLPVPERVTFRYRLDGYDRDWHDAGTRRQAFYADLPPGRFTFRFMAANGDNAWNDDAAVLRFSVAPAYYQTDVFRAFVVIASLALLLAAY